MSKILSLCDIYSAVRVHYFEYTKYIFTDIEQKKIFTKKYSDIFPYAINKKKFRFLINILNFLVRNY